MRIVFLCGSLEPGKDGVGDYTRRLAAALIKQGHYAAAVALNDKHVNTSLPGMQDIEGISLPVLRLPAGLNGTQVFDAAIAWIDAFDPNWLSLQFVPFAFHPKGLASQLSSLLLRLGKKRKWHIMVHELWVGMDKKAAKKQVLWGLLQRRLIRSLFARLQPAVIHTQSLLYQAQLSKLGIHPDYLPLFSNIPAMGKRYIHPGQNGMEKPAAVSMVLFGTILAGAPIEDFAVEAAAYGLKNGIPVSLTMVGRVGGGQERWVNACKAAGLTVSLLGEQPAERISAVLANATIGISTTAMALADKSGAVAAMHEHGIPVLCVSAVWQPRGINHLMLPPGILEYRVGNLETCLESKINFSRVNTVSSVALALTEKLLSAGSHNKLHR